MSRRRAQRRSALVRYAVTPLVGAVLSAVGITAFWLFESLTGYRGNVQPLAEPKSLAESWPDLAFVGLIAVVTLLCLSAERLFDAGDQLTRWVCEEPNCQNLR